MAALDNAFRDRALQGTSEGSVSWGAHTYLSLETLPLGG